MTRLAPAPERPWRCHGCWARHPSIDPICPHTNLPRDLR
jgi:hypothetical protein